VSEFYELARALHIPGRSRMTKPELPSAVGEHVLTADVHGISPAAAWAPGEAESRPASPVPVRTDGLQAGETSRTVGVADLDRSRTAGFDGHQGDKPDAGLAGHGRTHEHPRRGRPGR
jgi:hypothetical protein